MNQKVLVFRAEILKALGEFQGFTLDVERYLPTILDPANIFFLDREKAEHSPEFKQLIAYVVLRHKDSLFTYIRGKRSREARLKNLRSIALGGHIEQIDVETASSRQLYYLAAKRELDEEVIINSEYIENVIALINDDSNEVGRVHFGILHVWNLREPYVLSKEELILSEGFIPMRQLKQSNELENWSRIALNILEITDHGFSSPTT